MQINRLRKTWLLCAIITLLASLLVYRPGYSGLWLDTFFEWAHVPVFGLVSLCFLALVPNSLSVRRRFAYAFTGSVFLAVLSEAGQIPMNRDASWQDIFSDAAGAASFLVAAFAFGKKPTVAVVWGALAGAILLWSAFPLITVSHAIAQRNFQFPVIFDGDINSNSTLVTLQNVDANTQWSKSNGQTYTRVEFSGAFWSLLEFHDPYPNWNDYSNLYLDLEIEGDSAMVLNFRIQDRIHRSGNQDQSDRFDRKFTLGPGHARLAIPIRDIAGAPLNRPMDVAEIDRLVIYSSFRNAYRAIRIYEIRLD